MVTTKIMVDQFLYYLSKKDLENLTQLFAEKVDWNVPENENLDSWLGQRNRCSPRPDIPFLKLFQ